MKFSYSKKSKKKFNSKSSTTMTNDYIDKEYIYYFPKQKATLF